jgi:GTP-binding protein Era
VSNFRSGLVTLVGRPNVGKSTLLNRLVGAKVSITSPRAQTTRHRLLGIKTTEHAQFVYIDTPGLHPVEGNRLGQYMNRAARGSLAGVDAVLLVVTAEDWTPGDDDALRLVAGQGLPVVLAINMVDRLPDKGGLLPLIAAWSKKAAFAEIVPVSARRGDNLEALERALVAYLPAQPPLYPPDRLTDRSERFLAAELVREQVFRGFGQEVPYAAAVQIEKFRREKGVLHVSAAIWVEKEGQKAILIGKGGERMKQIGTRARLAMQKAFGAKVHLELWAKVRRHWSDDARALQTLGYGEE